VDAYWPLSSQPQPDGLALQQAWQPIAQQLRSFSEKLGKRVLFTEAGYRSIAQTATDPGDWHASGPVDEQAQAIAYQALLESVWDQPWFAGVHWWMWDGIGTPQDQESLSYSPHGKKAEAVLRKFWAAAAPDRTATIRQSSAKQHAAASKGDSC
jgi:hypothetical protein